MMLYKPPVNNYLQVNIPNIFIVSTILLLLFNCNTPTGNDDNEEEPVFIPTTEVQGPGGPAYITGNIRNYLDWDEPVTNTDIFIMNQNDYDDTLLYVFINSTDASFRITELPLDTLDLIFTHQTFFSRKVSRLRLKPTGNSFNNSNSSGYFADSTLFMISEADSFVDGITQIGYGPGVFVNFKVGVADSISWSIVQASGCDTLHVYHHHDPVFDPIPWDVYGLRCNDIPVVYDKVNYFIWHNEVYSCSPVMVEIFVDYP